MGSPSAPVLDFSVTPSPLAVPPLQLAVPDSPQLLVLQASFHTGSYCWGSLLCDTSPLE